MTQARAQQLPLDLGSHPSLARDDLVVSEANAFAVGAVDAWPEWPHPVVVVVGPKGSGKTHLACAWQDQSGAAVFMPGDTLPEPPFAVVIEDVDRGDYAEEDLFALVNAARLGNGFVMLTSRVRPAALTLRTPDLLSRLRAATVLEMAAPDDDLLVGVLMKLAADRQLELDPRLLDFALRRMDRSLDGAAELVRRLDLATLAARERLSRPLLKRVLDEMSVETAPPS
ncbi:HdaA/DnaA family protein [Aureimonas jatrophae]|uniref:Hda lid domain-containing protein n=1 Tax=Aureimonas jatrophae TaxID=1166073 RepID=A0A1H0GBR4_9HYPH|nr:hypothetical protein [Aureimonas jatrophae]MBB3949500.1 chromosomal replication initiation ATPase DnaA [Aureimonas jatrophae]SDO04306.1 hypothetical protein SAMN05192530_10353 [Aureimonas jatrophae]